VSKTVLVIDDREDNRLIVVDSLQQEFAVLQAGTAREGIELAEAARPDLILMDLRLPDINGYDATRSIKSRPALRSVPIIAVTSYALTGDEVKARAAGCDDYLAKPFEPGTLLALIRRYLA